MKLCKEQAKTDMKNSTKNKVLNETSSPWIFISQLTVMKFYLAFAFKSALKSTQFLKACHRNLF